MERRMLEEDRRLDALRALAVLDTPPERIFDNLAEAARSSFDTPIAMVSFVDAARQWFKACPGLETKETSRDIAFCDHTIRSDGPLVILDATKDPRFADNPLVTADPQVRFYAGAPLILPGGERVGTLCVIDLRTRESFSEADRARLASLAAAVVEALLMRRRVVRHEAMAAVSRRKTTMLEQAESLVGLGAWRWNPLTDEFQASTAAWRTLGYQSSRPRRLAEVFAQAEGGPQRLLAFLNSASPDRPAAPIEIRIDLPDGDTRTIALRAAAEQAEGRPISVFGTLLDVTEARRTENALRARETTLRNMIDHAQNAIVWWGEDGVIRSWNQQAEQVFGWPAYEVVGKTLEELIIPARFRSAHRQGLRRFLETGNLKEVERRFEIIALRRDGEEFPIELALSVVEGPEGWEFTGLMHDISARRAEMELFENAFHHAPIGMTLVSPDGRFLKVNEALCRITGRSEDELLAADIRAVTHPDDLDGDLEQMDQLLAGKVSSYAMAKRYIRPDGGHSWVQLSVSLVRNEDGSPKHFVSQVEDRNAQKAAEHALRDSEARYRLMAENTTDMVATTRLDGRLSFVSPACEILTGWTAAELVENKATEFAHPDDVGRMQELFHKVIAGEPSYAVRWRARHKHEDRWVWLESSPSLATAQGENGEALFLDVVRDVSVQVAQEEALAEARIAAEAAAAAKAEFLANMSHEIRTPLTAVIGFGSLISARDDLAPDCRQYVDRICSASRGLLTIVNDVLDFSKLEAGQVEIKPRPMTPVEATADAVSMFRGQAADKGLDLTMRTDLDQGLTVMADPERFRQVLLNLVGNAVKFTEAGSVSVFLGWEADRLRLEVRDTGAGLDAEARTKLFQRFSQVDASSTRRHGGTGLGLAICRGLIEAMGGEISVDSTLGEGSCFRFDIAAPAAAPATGAEEAVDHGLLQDLRVLVVDDNPQNRELSKALLGRLGMEVTVAEGGLQALGLLGVAPFDVVLMDLRMPGMDGRETLQRLRSEAGPNQWMPVIAFTAGADLDEAGYSAFDGVVNKPIDIRQLAEVLDVVLSPQAEPAWEAAVG
jgi:PAS domain S-box-containing protein